MRSSRSNTATWCPARLSRWAQASPAGPEPITATLLPVRATGGRAVSAPSVVVKSAISRSSAQTLVIDGLRGATGDVEVVLMPQLRREHMVFGNAADEIKLALEFLGSGSAFLGFHESLYNSRLRLPGQLADCSGDHGRSAISIIGFWPWRLWRGENWRGRSVLFIPGARVCRRPRRNSLTFCSPRSKRLPNDPCGNA